MPVSGPSQLIQTIDKFLVHWAIVDRQLAGLTPLVVLAAVDREALAELRATLEAGPRDLPQRLLEERLAAEAVAEARAAARATLALFVIAVRGNFPETLWARLLPLQLGPQFAAWHYLAPLRQAHRLWEKLAAEEPDTPLLPPHGGPPFSRPLLAEQIAALEAALDALTDARLEAALARATWELLEEHAVAVLKAYGHAVKARFGDAPPVDSLPQLWPGARRGTRRGPGQKQP